MVELIIFELEETIEISLTEMQKEKIIKKKTKTKSRRGHQRIIGQERFPKRGKT